MNISLLSSCKTSLEEETISLGARIALSLKAGDVVCLEGELGAGKTTLVRGILSGLVEQMCEQMVNKGTNEQM